MVSHNGTEADKDHRLKMIARSMVELVGNTPLVVFEQSWFPETRIHVKLESWNPTGSVKDRAALANIRAALASGDLREGKAILDASSGNMACALAYFGSCMGFPVEVVCSNKLTADKKDFIDYFGAKVHVFGEITREGNLFCADLARNEPEKYCFLDQLHNPNNPLASFETLGPEISDAIPDVKAVFGSIGSGGSMCGVSRHFRVSLGSEGVRLVGVESASGTKVPGTGAFVDGDYITPFIVELESYLDETQRVSMPDVRARTSDLARQGIFTGFQGGAVLQGLKQSLEGRPLAGDVVMIIGDSGWKNLSKIL
jgi:cysteine synthase